MAKGNTVRFLWTEKQDFALFNLPDLVANIAKNYHYSPKGNTRFRCNASKNGVGACVEQDMEEVVCDPISFASRQLNAAEAKYGTSELELLGVV